MDHITYPSFYNFENERNKKANELATKLILEMTGIGPRGMMDHVSHTMAQHRHHTEELINKAILHERKIMHNAMIAIYRKTISGTEWGICRHCGSTIVALEPTIVCTENGIHISVFCSCRDLIYHQPARLSASMYASSNNYVDEKEMEELRVNATYNWAKEEEDETTNPA